MGANEQQPIVKEVSRLVGEAVEYSIKKDVTSSGLVLDKVLAKENSSDTFAVTKYLIEDFKSGAIVHIASWRILKVVPFPDNYYNKA